MNAHEERLLSRGDLAGLRAIAERKAEAKRSAKARRRKREPRARSKPTKAERAAAAAAETARIRAACVARANGYGELCGRALDPERAELCHLEGGVGKKRQEQKVSNCVMEHPEHHRSLDKSPLAWLSEVKGWAARHGYAVPRRFVKLEALRGAPEPVPVAVRSADHG